MRDYKFDLDMVRAARKDWTPLYTDNMDEEKKALYLKKKKAIDLYIDGEPVRSIEEITGISRGTLARTLERCLTGDSNGELAGYAAPCQTPLLI